MRNRERQGVRLCQHPMQLLTRVETVDAELGGALRRVPARRSQKAHSKRATERRDLARHMAGTDNRQCLASELVGAICVPAMGPPLGLQMRQATHVNEKTQKGKLGDRSAGYAARGRAA